MPSIEYKMTCQTWECDTDWVILRYKQSIFGQFPLEFLQTGGPSTYSVAYLRATFKLLYEIPSTAKVIISQDNRTTKEDSTICSGAYDFSISDDGALLPTPRIGPQGKSKSRPFRDTGSNSTTSNSARSSINQNRLREKLLMRDGCCVATGEDNEEIVMAAHIVPLSLGQEFLDEITSHPRQVTLYSVTNGLLLRPDLHTAFDRFLWGIWLDEHGIHYLHIFGESYRSLHGNMIEFRTTKKSKLPNPKLLSWHYSQCLMARIRGYYVN